MKEEYKELKLTDTELWFLIDQLGLRQMEITKSLKLAKEQGKKENEDIICSLNVDKRECDKLRKYMQYARR